MADFSKTLKIQPFLGNLTVNIITWKHFVLTLGIFLGTICFLMTGDELILPSNYMTIIITYGSIVLFGSIFSYRKDQLKEREKRIAAEAANQAKSDFISNMQHDLKTPFAGK